MQSVIQATFSSGTSVLSMSQRWHNRVPIAEVAHLLCKVHRLCRLANDQEQGTSEQLCTAFEQHFLVGVQEGSERSQLVAIFIFLCVLCMARKLGGTLTNERCANLQLVYLFYHRPSIMEGRERSDQEIKYI